jgi:integrase
MYYVNKDGCIEKQFQRVPIYDQVTIHCARRSGICSLVKSGVNMITVMAFSGHKTETALMSYVGINTMEAAQEMSTHKFFA